MDISGKNILDPGNHKCKHLEAGVSGRHQEKNQAVRRREPSGTGTRGGDESQKQQGHGSSMAHVMVLVLRFHLMEWRV